MAYVRARARALRRALLCGARPRRSGGNLTVIVTRLEMNGADEHPFSGPARKQKKKKHKRKKGEGKEERFEVRFKARWSETEAAEFIGYRFHRFFLIPLAGY